MTTATAQVFGHSAVFGQAQVSSRAKVFDQAQVFDRAKVFDQAQVYGRAKVFDQAQIYGQAKVFDQAQVYGRARIYGQAQAYGQAQVYGQGDIASTRHYLTIGPVGSEDRTVTVHRHYDGPNSATWGHLVIVGCWQGTIDELVARIAMDGDHEWSGDASRWRSDYEGVIALARPRVAEWASEPLTEEDHARWAGSECDREHLPSTTEENAK